jgi:hypothetical protein
MRHRRFNDVVLVGDDFFHVMQVVRHGHLKHIVTKNDLSARIRAAKTFNNDVKGPDDDLFIKGESEDAFFASISEPPQFLVLTLSSDDVVFLYLKKDDSGVLRFIQQTLPMPTFDRTLFQTGEHLAIDPSSRALAVAANEREVIIYSAKTKARMQEQLQADDPDWCPVALQRRLRVSGVIQHMDFLIPSANDQDHIVLLLIVIDQRKTKALWIDWNHSSELRHAQVHAGQAIDTQRTVPSLLIPLLGAAFLLITGSDMKMFRNILSGSVTVTPVGPPTHETVSPGSSPRQPVWTSWCRPRRNQSTRQEKDILYLMREDGIVFLLEIGSGLSADRFLVTSNAGDAECHAGTAFASLGDDRDPDILAFVGEQSNGQVVSIGQWAAEGRRMAELSRLDTMEMQRAETLSNWASCTDMIVSTIPHSSGRVTRQRDTVFVTSGRQPYGSITELRQGLEARLILYFPLPDLRSVVGVWALPNMQNGSMIMVLSTPISTRLIEYKPDVDDDELNDEIKTVLETEQRTLAIDILPNGYLLQITEKSVYAVAHISAGYEDHDKHIISAGSIFTAAAIEPNLVVAIVAERSDSGYKLLAFDHHLEHDDATDDACEGLQQTGEGITLDTDVLALATTQLGTRLLGVCITANGTMHVISKETGTGADIERKGSLDLSMTEEQSCDHVVLLRSSSANVEDVLAVCGLRDGTIRTVTISSDAVPSFSAVHKVHFGQSTVSLNRMSTEPTRAYARSGLDLCTLSWDGCGPSTLQIQSLWVSDRARPQLAQGEILAVAKMPSSEHLEESDMTDLPIFVSSEEIWVAAVDSAVTTVPRQLAVSGTPKRLLYTELHRSYVCASVVTGVRTFPSGMPHARPEERRQIWPVIDFIAAEKDTLSFTFRMQPGERVYALLEWSLAHGPDGKRYSFIMVGGSYTKADGTERGRIAFLQPVTSRENRIWEVINVTEGKVMKFEAPINALALYDDMTLVACSGPQVIVKRFSISESRWSDICDPCLLASSGVSIVVEGPLIHISTQDDALVTLRLTQNSPGNEASHDVRLVLVAKPPRADQSLSHAVVPLTPNDDPEHDAPHRSVALLSTKDGRLVGTTWPSPSNASAPGQVHRAALLFDAELPRSLTRIRRANIGVPWRPCRPEGVVTDDLVGITTDGSMIGICLLDSKLWRRLFWLERLCDWSKIVSPHSVDRPGYSVHEDMTNGRERAFPVGLSSTADEEMIMSSNAQGLDLQQHMHVNGDVLNGLLELGGAATLKEILHDVAAREDRAGRWVKDHLDEELEVAEELMKMIKALLGSWM